MNSIMDSDSFGTQDPSRDTDSTEAWSGFNQGSGFDQGSGSSCSLADAVPYFFNYGLRDLGTGDGGNLVSLQSDAIIILYDQNKPGFYSG